MLPNDNLKAVCSVIELTKKLRLSRARFYQLQKMGIFPKPVYCIRTKRPFYPLDLQQKCLAIRKTGIGHNGQPIIFYSVRKDKSIKPQDQLNHGYKQLAGALRKMGLNVAVSTVKNAINALYPEGMPNDNEGVIIGELFRYFRQGV